MINDIYDIHYGRLGVDMLADITQEDLDELIEIAKDNNCRQIIKWTNPMEFIVLWDEKNF